VTLSGIETTERRAALYYVSQELVGIREEVVMTYTRHHDDICLDELRQIIKDNWRYWNGKWARVELCPQTSLLGKIWEYLNAMCSLLLVALRKI
jgi:hypothetical protein